MRWKKKERKIFIIAAALTILSATIYCSWPLGFWLNPIASRTGLASELGAYGQPYNWIFIFGDVFSGVFLVVAVALLISLYKLTRWSRTALILLALYGIFGALDASIPLHCIPSEQVCGSVWSDPMLIGHGIFDIGGSLSLIGTLLAAALYVHRRSTEWMKWIYVIGIGGTIFAVASGILYVWGGPGYWAQRYYITLSCIWVASVPFVLRPKRAMLQVLNK